MIEVAGIEAVTQDALARTMAVNLVAPVVLLQALLPGMRAARHGRVVNIGSRAAGQTWAHGLWRVKGALAAMTRTWALELAADGITVNTVAPGPVATELFNASNPRRSAHARWRPRSRWAAAACRKRWRTWWPCSWTGAPPS